MKSVGSGVLQQGPHGEPGREGPTFRTRSAGRKRKYQDLSGEDPIPLDALEPTSEGPVPITPCDIDFRECILEPRGIIINSRTRSLPDPYTHFASGHTAETKYKRIWKSSKIYAFGWRRTLNFYVKQQQSTIA